MFLLRFALRYSPDVGARRQEGFEPTAEACRRRLVDLGQKDPVSDPQTRKESEAELAAFRAGLKNWTVSNGLHS